MPKINSFIGRGISLHAHGLDREYSLKPRAMAMSEVDVEPNSEYRLTFLTKGAGKPATLRANLFVDLKKDFSHQAALVSGPLWTEVSMVLKTGVIENMDVVMLRIWREPSKIRAESQNIKIKNVHLEFIGEVGSFAKDAGAQIPVKTKVLPRTCGRSGKKEEKKVEKNNKIKHPVLPQNGTVVGYQEVLKMRQEVLAIKQKVLAIRERIVMQERKYDE